MTDLLPLMSYCLLMSGTPGPNNVMLTTSGANFGYRATLPQILGILLGGFVLTLACCLGLGQLFLAWPVAQQVLRIGGALYLLFLAWRLSGATMAQARALPRPLGFTHGALFQFINPKNWLKAVTLASVFMPSGLPPLQAALLVALLSSLMGFPAISMWALFGVAIRRLLEKPAVHRGFNLCMAAALAALALNFLR
ncbi:LysE family translocator [Roseateles sp. DB2]|uniref:LysE family translocator n=1 Tax=Roseateles sp. DB2 TaxID=3453717 RepID=UPI003EECB913